MIDLVFPEYHIFIDLPNIAKGGVALLLKKDKFSNITELGPDTGFDLKNKCKCTQCIIENKWLSLYINNQKVIIGGIYRHPKGNIEHFNSNLHNTIKQIKYNTLAIILGDININLMSESNEKVQSYLNNYLESNFIPCVTLPTRIRNHSATLIDHIFLKNPRKFIQNKCSSGNLVFDISDHLPNFMFLDINTPLIKDRPYVRLFTENKIKTFKENLEKEKNLITDDHLYDVDSSYEIFSTNYLELFNKYFPYVRQSKKSFKNKPYITKGIKVSINHRNKLYHKYLNNPTDLNEQIWKKFRNKTSFIIKKSQELYYNKMLQNQHNNSKNLWNTFGNILNKNKKKHKNIGSLNINNENITDPQTISTSFHKYFSQIGENMANKLVRNGNNEFIKYLGSPANQSILFYKTDSNEILNTINNLKCTNSSGPDEISSKFIKMSAFVLVPALEKIFNLSLKSGVYPQKLKTAKVIPIYKKGDPTQVSNYRPISILNTINKIFEKILHSRLTKFIKDFNILYKYQFGFRENHSTELALIEMVDEIKLSLDRKNMTCGMFLDLSKAFDTVNHNILIHKLDHYGIRGKALDLLKSYLGNREQYVNLNNFKSNKSSINVGVPQGSVLGPLFFILFINDLPNCCPLGNVRIFADDTNIFFHCNDIKTLINTGKIIMNNLNLWFLNNKLFLNTDKSSFVVFRSPRKKIANLPDCIEFEEFKINRTSSTKFLGVILDEHLTWKPQIKEICNKLKSMFHIFYSLRDFLSRDNIKTIYYTLIYSKIEYGIAVYGQAGATKIKQIQVLQNRLLKVLSSKKFRYSTDRLHNDFGILKVHDIVNQEILTFVKNYFLDKLPVVFQNYFTLFGNHNTMHTRNSHKLIRKITPKSNFGATSVKFKGSDLWNKLSNDLKTCINTKQFRIKYKSSLMPYVINS